MNALADHPQHIPFDLQSREQLLQTKHAIEGRIRAAKTAFVEAQHAHNRDEVARLRVRLSRLKSAASAASLELALRNARRKSFERAAHEVLDDEMLQRIEAALA